MTAAKSSTENILILKNPTNFPNHLLIYFRPSQYSTPNIQDYFAATADLTIPTPTTVTTFATYIWGKKPIANCYLPIAKLHSEIEEYEEI